MDSVLFVTQVVVVFGDDHLNGGPVFLLGSLRNNIKN